MANGPSGSTAGGESPPRPDLWSRKPLKWLKRPVTYVVGLVGVVALAIAQESGVGLVQHPPWVGGKSSVASPAASQTISPTTASASPGRIGKPVASKPVDLLTYYSPSGLMGDIGDITKAEQPGKHLVHMTYEAKGRGPHEWDYKYINRGDQPPALQVRGDHVARWRLGSYCSRWIRSPGSIMISWDARSLSGNVFVRFLAGSENWVWDEKAGVKVDAPYPGSLPNLPLGEPELTGQWKHFTYRVDKNVSSRGPAGCHSSFRLDHQLGFKSR